MKIGFLILCHTDPEHIGRLARRLSRTEDFFVWIHVDSKVEAEPFRQAAVGLPRVCLTGRRQDCRWGRFGTVRAELSLMEAALEEGCDRLVLLQGLDYPLKSNEEILAFFRQRPDTEFIRACRIAGSRDSYHAEKCRRYWLLNDSLPARAWNRLNDRHPLYLRSGVYREQGQAYPCCWGSAQWALTAGCARYILDFVREHPGFSRYYSHIFPCDETFFASIVHNSPYSARTAMKGPEPEQRYLVNWRNLHYFEYPKLIRVFTEDDYDFLRQREELFVRKVTTHQSARLLDLLDRDAGLPAGRDGTEGDGTV